SDERQKKESRAQDMFALGDPGDRFDPKRMNRKQCSNKRSAPESTGRARQKKEQQKRSNCMKQNICEMMAARCESENLAVEHVRNDRERMPIVGLGIDKGLLQSVDAESLADQPVSVDVSFVVEVYKIVVQGLAKDDPDQSDYRRNHREPRQIGFS